MNITVTARHFKAKQELQDYVRNEAKSLERQFDRIISIEWILAYQKKDQIAEIVLQVPKETLRAEAISDDMYKSIDQAVDKMERQLNKYKNLLRGT